MRTHHKRRGGGTHDDYVRAKWQADFARAELGDDPELADALREIGLDAGYLSPPSGDDAMNASIRIQAGRGTQADRDVLQARRRAHGSGKEN